MYKYSAYTILEIVIVMGILVAVSIVVLPITLQQVEEARAEHAAIDISSRIFSAQQNAYNGKNNVEYGIRFTNNNYFLFTGNSYATATDAEAFDLLGQLKITQINLEGGSDEIIFEQGSLMPSVTGYIQMTDNISTYRVTINSEGLITIAKV